VVVVMMAVMAMEAEMLRGSSARGEGRNAEGDGGGNCEDGLLEHCSLSVWGGMRPPHPSPSKSQRPVGRFTRVSKFRKKDQLSAMFHLHFIFVSSRYND
jgi:hypothetical protein